MLKKLDEKSLIAYLRDECNRAGGQKHWAKKADLSEPYVSDVINGRRNPGDGILKALGFEKRVEYVRVE